MAEGQAGPRCCCAGCRCSLASFLRSIRPEAPGDPVTLFTDWPGQAIEAGVIEPHVMTLSPAASKDSRRRGC
jgi:pyridoxine/pyridoxamine 5'-phosphate oxidase